MHCVVCVSGELCFCVRCVHSKVCSCSAECACVRFVNHGVCVVSGVKFLCKICALSKCN